MARKRTDRVLERGDLQTPPGLAREIVERLARITRPPASILEPTCGTGSFLVAALERWPHASRVVGIDIDAGHLARASEALGGSGSRRRVELIRSDVFTHDLEGLVASLPDPVLCVGNPPWVTAAELTRMGSSNTPRRSRRPDLRGLDAITGRSNFDVSQWIVENLVTILAGRDATVSFILKTTAARRALERFWRAGSGVSGAAMHRIDAAAAFGASVAACVLTLRTAGPCSHDCALHDSLDAPSPSRVMGWRDGSVVTDAAAYDTVAHLATAPRKLWRSGLKHDCAAVMILRRGGDGLRNGLGERVDIEPACVHPLANATDVAREREADRFVIVTQHTAGEPTDHLRRDAPRTWRYLLLHADRLDGRRSSVWKNRPRFSLFGVGPYTFAPYKVAVSALHPDPAFRLLEPREGRPVIPDDTVVFRGFESRAEAVETLARLRSPEVRVFLTSQMSEGAKRPLTVGLIDRLDLERVRNG